MLLIKVLVKHPKNIVMKPKKPGWCFDVRGLVSSKVHIEKTFSLLMLWLTIRVSARFKFQNFFPFWNFQFQKELLLFPKINRAYQNCSSKESITSSWVLNINFLKINFTFSITFFCFVFLVVNQSLCFLHEWWIRPENSSIFFRVWRLFALSWQVDPLVKANDIFFSCTAWWVKYTSSNTFKFLVLWRFSIIHYASLKVVNLFLKAVTSSFAFN